MTSSLSAQNRLIRPSLAFCISAKRKESESKRREGRMTELRIYCRRIENLLLENWGRTLQITDFTATAIAQLSNSQRPSTRLYSSSICSATRLPSKRRTYSLPLSATLLRPSSSVSNRLISAAMASASSGST